MALCPLTDPKRPNDGAVNFRAPAAVLRAAEAKARLQGQSLSEFLRSALVSAVEGEGPLIAITGGGVRQASRHGEQK